MGVEKKKAVRRILLKDREVEAVPAPSVLSQFIFVCKKVKVLPELGGNIARGGQTAKLSAKGST